MENDCLKAAADKDEAIGWQNQKVQKEALRILFALFDLGDVKNSSPAFVRQKAKHSRTRVKKYKTDDTVVLFCIVQNAEKSKAQEWAIPRKFTVVNLFFR